MFIWVPSLFPLVNLARGLLILFILKNPILDFLIFLLFLFVFNYYLSHLYYCFPSVDLGFCLFFFSLILLGGRKGYLFQIFLLSWGRSLSLWISLLELLSIDIHSLLSDFFSLNNVCELHPCCLDLGLILSHNLSHIFKKKQEHYVSFSDYEKWFFIVLMCGEDSNEEGRFPETNIDILLKF